MLEHLSIGVRNIDKARVFYDALFLALGYERLASMEKGSGYGSDRHVFWIFESESPVPPDRKSGLHFCFTAPDKGSVESFHAAALAHGGEDNGPPGIRPEYASFYYAAFVIDPDGYRLEAFFHMPE